MLQAIKNGIASTLGECAGALISSNAALEQKAAGVFARNWHVRVVRSLGFRTLASLRRRARETDSVRVATLRDGGKLCVDLRSLTHLYFFADAYERNTIQYIREHLEGGSVFLDIGANLGVYTIVVGTLLRARGGGEVLSYEPNPGVGALLERSVEESGLTNVVKTFPFAVWRADADAVDLYVGDNPGLSSLTPWEGHFQSGELSVDKRLPVRCRSLDSIVRERDIKRIDWMKIDVEGAETDVLAGMSETLTRLRPPRIICETHLGGAAASLLRSKGYTATMLESLIGDWGNVLFTL